MKSIIIRTLGGKEIGYGHFYRCLSLAKGIILLKKDVRIIFILNEELVELLKGTGFEFVVSNNLNEDFNIIEGLYVDLFIFDSYLGDNEYLKTINKKTKLMLVDDNNDIYDSSIPDILYNGNIFAPKLGYPYVKDQLQLLGSKYLVMKEEYWNNSQNENIYKEGVLVTTGGSDKYGVMVRILGAIKAEGVKIRAVIGPGYSDEYIKEVEDMRTENVELIYKPNSLKGYINSSKVVITAGGSTVYEILSLKSIPILFSIADNQDLICTTLNQMGIEYIGKCSNIDYSILSSLLEKEYNKGIDQGDELYKLAIGEGILFVAQKILGYLK